MAIEGIRETDEDGGSGRENRQRSEEIILGTEGYLHSFNPPLKTKQFRPVLRLPRPNRMVDQLGLKVPEPEEQHRYLTRTDKQIQPKTSGRISKVAWSKWDHALEKFGIYVSKETVKEKES